MAITYNTTKANCRYVYRATGGGVTFSANLADTAAFDYFTDTAVVNDAIYFSHSLSSGYQAFASVFLNVGTAMAGTGITIAWEYSNGTDWLPIYNLSDGSNGFTTTGAVEVKFPIQPNHRWRTLNGITPSVWVRARITALTTITEGGANQTTAAKVGNGRVNVTGYNDTTPCTFTELANWCIANEPTLDVEIKSSDTFYFPNCIPNIAAGSTLRSTNEKVYIGNGAANIYFFICNGLWSGTLVGTDGWEDASCYYFCWRSPSSSLSASGARIYGGYWGTFSSLVNGQTGTVTGFIGRSAGTWVGTFMDRDGYYNLGYLNRCTGDGEIIIATTPTRFPDNHIIANPGLRIFNVYGCDLAVSNLKYGLPTNNFISWSTQYFDEHPIVTFTDIDPILPVQAGATYHSVRRGISTPANVTHVWMYDESAGTYTNYTAAASNATADDVPLSGDVGDYLLFYRKSANQGQDMFTFTITNQTNDYEYVWEYYCNRNTWIEVPVLHDLTENFTKSEVIYCGIDGTSSGTNNGSKVLSIAGPTTVSGTWYRLRIVTKGTGTPTFTKVQRQEQSGIYSGYPIVEQYTYNLNITDSSNVPIEAANVLIKDAQGNEITTVSTNASGDIDSQTLIRKKMYFDPSHDYDADYNYRDLSLNPYTITIRKYGYYSQDISKIIAGKSADGAKLLSNIYLDVDEATASEYTGIDIDHTTNTITINEDHTMQEVYDYCECWAAQNICCSEPFVTTDGQNFTSTYDLVLDNCALTGTGRISIVVNTVTYIGTATSTLDIVAVDGTHTNIKLTGLVANSRVQLYSEDTATELYNDIVTDTTLIFPIIWTVDENIRIRVPYVDGVTAKARYETNATLTATGINLNIYQEDDDVYNSIGIDGSTVTECSISGSVLRVNVDDPDNATTAQRIYAFQVYWLSTEEGIADQELYIQAIDSTHYTFYGGMKIKNMDLTNPLNITGGNLEPDTGAATDILDTTGGMILINPETVVYAPYSTVTNSYTNNIVGIEV